MNCCVRWKLYISQVPLHPFQYYLTQNKRSQGFLNYYSIFPVSEKCWCFSVAQAPACICEFLMWRSVRPSRPKRGNLMEFSQPLSQNADLFRQTKQSPKMVLCGQFSRCVWVSVCVYSVCKGLKAIGQIIVIMLTLGSIPVRSVHARTPSSLLQTYSRLPRPINRN